MRQLQTEVLVVGGGVGGTAAAIQAARCGSRVVLVSEGDWLGGMLTSAGVSAPDGNELRSWQTGLWGQFLGELYRQQPGGLHHSWVSFFSYEPAIGARIFAQWVEALPQLTWIVGGVPLGVVRQGDRLVGVQFAEVEVRATIVIDGTELGDLLALGEIPHRWGWEPQALWQEPSAPSQMALSQDPFFQAYPVQAPTWVVVMQDFGANTIAPEIPLPPHYDGAVLADRFGQAWVNYDPIDFLNYGRLPGDRFMINWPICGNDYDQGCDRLVGSREQRQQFDQEARWHSQAFAHWIQHQLGRRYGLALGTFPVLNPGTNARSNPKSNRASNLGGDAYALHLYYRESRRLKGVVTVREQDLLPRPGGQTAALPVDESGQVTAIAVGNYVNDHHYTQRSFSLAPKAVRWGGRWTGTPFSLPYGCLVPETIDGVLVCEKNIAVSHMANGATRLQPVVMALGQAAGMAAALCIQQHCDPRELSVRTLQAALLQDPYAPATIVPLFDLLPENPQWAAIQMNFLDHPEAYPLNGYWGTSAIPIQPRPGESKIQPEIQRSGYFHPVGEERYELWIDEIQTHQIQANQTSASMEPAPSLSPTAAKKIALVTLDPHLNQQWPTIASGSWVTVQGYENGAGKWFQVNRMEI
ncbi:MAG: FAD-dependent oxidoreductase, partial [Prochlorotrichaceae cyanobacterium]